MPRTKAFLLALTLVAASLAVPPAIGAAAGPVAAEDGGTYEIPVVLEFDVDSESEEYSVRTATDRLFVNALRAENGTVTLDTESMDSGEYVLIRQDSEEVVFEFTLVGGVTETPTGTETPTATDGETPSVDPAPSRLRVSSEDRPDAVPAADGGVFWIGQDLAFRVDGDTEYVLHSESDTFGALGGASHERYLNTTSLEPGMYTVERPDGHVVYRFRLTVQSATASVAGESIGVESNRDSYDAVLSAPNVTTEQLLSAVPAATERDGRVVLTDLSSDANVELNREALPVGNHTLTLSVPDTGAGTNATVSVSDSWENTTPTTESGNPAVDPETATQTATATPTANPTTTPTSEPASESPTTTDAPGFGPVAALIAVFGLVALGRAR